MTELIKITDPQVYYKTDKERPVGELKDIQIKDGKLIGNLVINDPEISKLINEEKT